MLAKASSAGIAAQIAKAALQACGTLLFARILGPQDIGTFAVVLPFVIFGQLFASAGLAQYLLHHPEVVGQRLDSLAAASFYLSALVALTVALIAAPISEMLHMAIVGPILAAMSIGIILEAYGAFLRSIALRSQRYGFAAGIDVISAAGGLALGGIHAFLSPTAWVLVSQSLGSSLLAAVLFAASVERLPKAFNFNLARKAFNTIPGAANYAVWLVNFGLVNQVIRNSDNVLIGWYWGPKALGPYALAYRLLMLPLQVFNAPLSNVVLISLPESAPSERSVIYGRLLRLSAFLGCSTVVVMNANVSLFADLILGPQWSEIATIFHALATAAAFQSATSLTGSLYQLTNQTKALFVVSAVASVVTVFAFVLSLDLGAYGIAVTYSFLSSTFFFPLLFFACRYGRVSFKISLMHCMPCLGAAIMMIFAGTLLDLSLQDGAPMERILLGAGYGIASVVILAAITFGFRLFGARSKADLSKLVFE